ncbi:hypothetical protein BDFB_011436 [Asbolus verrucosus]|uniref:Uncharacterized protein n=1 Tax=Asbolus verrucosus TaxID=1661398 RepID=A0A482V807_ASBVE|nr:hypothetical protein BDFB_011436 [Asbolus verrucosus]
MTKIYFWHKDNIGHVSLELSDRTYISYWPEATNRKNTIETRTYEDDVAAECRHPDEILDLPDGIMDETKTKLWWIDYVNNNRYHLPLKNCALVVRRALIMGDIFGGNRQLAPVLRMDLDVETLLPVVTPHNVFQWAKFYISA